MTDPEQRPPRSLAFQKWQAAADVDLIAGEARLRYITDVPGQQAVYLTKLDQAKAYQADPSVTPSYIAAEAVARSTTADQVAALILATAQLWSDVKGPAIEAARIAAKLAIDAAADAQAITTARDAGIDALRAL